MGLFDVQLEAELSVYLDEKMALIFGFGHCPEQQNENIGL